ncbi:MAG: ABC transporter ATP-binding protein [Candidatus Nealsonbacteria bacterium]|nr:ABC transporter ATP-binding protein [Candidatus Nealsonbacteria bacterium]
MIRIQNLNYAVGNFALQDVSLHVEPGEYFVLLGATGSGKTLLIESLCGLNRIDSGRISIDGVDVTAVEPRRRGIGYVPQDYALFSHKTVRENVRFGVKLQPSADRERLSIDDDPPEKTVMEMVGVSHLAKRSIRGLSGGERQRVALARALAIRPRVLLLDEPVSALDEQTRDTICRELKRLQRDSHTTTVHVCHNFAEMLTLADRVGIIDSGRILQTGTPQEILQRPVSARVAQFVRAGNLLTANAKSAGRRVELTCDGGLRLTAAVADPPAPDGKVTVMLRPENIQLGAAVPENVAADTTVIEAAVRDVLDFGPTVKVTVAVDATVELHVSLGKKEYNIHPINTGEHVFLTVAPEDVHVMPQ